MPWTFEPRKTLLVKMGGKTSLHPSVTCSIGKRVLMALLGCNGHRAHGGGGGGGKNTEISLAAGWAALPCRSRCQILAASVPTWFSLLPFCLPGHAGCFLLVPPGPGYRHGRGVRQLWSLRFLPGGRRLCSGSSFRVLR